MITKLKQILGKMTQIKVSYEFKPGDLVIQYGGVSIYMITKVTRHKKWNNYFQHHGVIVGTLDGILKNGRKEKKLNPYKKLSDLTESINFVNQGTIPHVDKILENYGGGIDERA